VLKSNKKSDFAQKNRGFYVDETDPLVQEVSLESVDVAFQAQSTLLNSVKEVFTPVDDDNLFESCVFCKKPIAKERLQQMPWAAHCDSCDSEEAGYDLCLKLAQAA
jgi:RNA polymerase-binding transcription factor DksA